MPNGNISWESAMARNNMNKSALCDALDPEYEKIVFESFRRQKFINFIGAELLRVLPGFCTLQLKYREKMTHDPACFHPGVIGALADSAGEFAALSLLPPDSSLATAGYRLEFAGSRSRRCPRCHCKGRQVREDDDGLHIGDLCSRDGSQNLCAMALMTFVPG